MDFKRKGMDVLLIVCLAAGLLPTSAWAAGTGNAIQLGTGSISGYDAANGYDYLYYGTRNGVPIQWRALDIKTNTGEEGLLLLSEYRLSNIKFQAERHEHNDGFYYKGSRHVDGACEALAYAYQSSDAQIWCNTFYQNSFNAEEQDAILVTNKSDTEHRIFDAANHILNQDKVFFLSAEEAENAVYGFVDKTARKGYSMSGTSAGKWWLRSPNKGFGSNVGYIDRNGNVYGTSTTQSAYARPAFNLNTSKVLFVSAAEDKKRR